MRKDDEILFEDSRRACRFLKILPPLCLEEIQFGHKTIICDWIYEDDMHLHAVRENPAPKRGFKQGNCYQSEFFSSVLSLTNFKFPKPLKINVIQRIFLLHGQSLINFKISHTFTEIFPIRKGSSFLLMSQSNFSFKVSSVILWVAC